MDDSKSDQVTRCSCEDCRAEFPDHESLSEHRTSCSGERSQPSATRPELPRNAPAADAENRMMSEAELMATINAMDKWIEETSESHNAILEAARRHMKELDRFQLQKDSLHKTLEKATRSATRPELALNAPAADTGSESNLLRSLDVEAFCTNLDAAIQWMGEASESRVATLIEAKRRMEGLNRFQLQKDSLHAALGEARARLELAIESNASESDRLLYKETMNRVTAAMDLLSKGEEAVTAAMEGALMTQVAVTQRVADCLIKERDVLKCLLSLEAENAEPASSEQTDGFGEK